MMRWPAILALLLVLGTARAFAAPPKVLPREAAEAVLKAFESKDAAALGEWGAKEQPQPWIVADELLSMGKPATSPTCSPPPRSRSCDRRPLAAKACWHSEIRTTARRRIRARWP